MKQLLLSVMRKMFKTMSLIQTRQKLHFNVINNQALTNPKQLRVFTAFLFKQATKEIDMPKNLL